MTGPIQHPSLCFINCITVSRPSQYTARRQVLHQLHHCVAAFTIHCSPAGASSTASLCRGLHNTLLAGRCFINCITVSRPSQYTARRQVLHQLHHCVAAFTIHCSPAGASSTASLCRGLHNTLLAGRCFINCITVSRPSQYTARRQVLHQLHHCVAAFTIHCSPAGASSTASLCRGLHNTLLAGRCFINCITVSRPSQYTARRQVLHQLHHCVAGRCFINCITVSPAGASSTASLCRRQVLHQLHHCVAGRCFINCITVSPAGASSTASLCRRQVLHQLHHCVAGRCFINCITVSPAGASSTASLCRRQVLHQLHHCVAGRCFINCITVSPAGASSTA
ncbi:hypothetical protein ACOMHN_000153 [Nucella lapillus]